MDMGRIWPYPYPFYVSPNVDEIVKNRFLTFYEYINVTKRENKSFATKTQTTKILALFLRVLVP